MRVKVNKLLIFIFFACANIWGLKSDLTREQAGLILGGGVYRHWLPNDNAFDPVPALMPTGTNSSASETLYIVPTRIGYFVDKPSAGFAIYGRYITSFQSAWTTSGNIEGTGSTRFGSVGVGGEISAYVLRATRARLGIAFNSEYILQKIALTHTPTNGTAASFAVSAESILLGAGLKPEIYLGDLWTLSIFAGYQYGINRSFKASTAGTFLGVDHAAGVLTSPSTGTSILSQQGGFLLEATLKLHFM